LPDRNDRQPVAEKPFPPLVPSQSRIIRHLLLDDFLHEQYFSTTTIQIFAGRKNFTAL
jgi:hypothetical protein